LRNSENTSAIWRCKLEEVSLYIMSIGTVIEYNNIIIIINCIPTFVFETARNSGRDKYHIFYDV